MDGPQFQQPQYQQQAMPQYAAAPTAYDMPQTNLQTAQSMLMAPGVAPQFQFTPGGPEVPQQQALQQIQQGQGEVQPTMQDPDKKPTGKKDKKRTAGKTRKTCC